MFTIIHTNVLKYYRNVRLQARGAILVSTVHAWIPYIQYFNRWDHLDIIFESGACERLLLLFLMKSLIQTCTHIRMNKKTYTTQIFKPRKILHHPVQINICACYKYRTVMELSLTINLFNVYKQWPNIGSRLCMFMPYCIRVRQSNIP